MDISQRMLRTEMLSRPVPRMMVAGAMIDTELSWATVNTFDAEEMAEFWAHQEQRANQRAKAALERLKSLGIVDEAGNSIGTEIPRDMQPGAGRDFGG